jgi:hypothetical protein
MTRTKGMAMMITQAMTTALLVRMMAPLLHLKETVLETGEQVVTPVPGMVEPQEMAALEPETVQVHLLLNLKPDETKNKNKAARELSRCLIL